MFRTITPTPVQGLTTQTTVPTVGTLGCFVEEMVRVPFETRPSEMGVGPDNRDDSFKIRQNPLSFICITCNFMDLLFYYWAISSLVI